jgi:hypothetical protein
LYSEPPPGLEGNDRNDGNRADVHAERIIATLEFIGIDFSRDRISATLEVTKHLDKLLKD